MLSLFRRGTVRVIRMKEINIIIIGAGASGIAAASRLLESGFSNITILEAEDRIGGRIFTERFGEEVIDFGAQWVHGEKENVVFKMADPLKLLTESITSLFDCTTSYVLSSGKKYLIYDLADIFQIISDIDNDSKRHFINNKGSVGEYFTTEFEKRLKEKNIPHEKWPVAKSILEWYEKLENSIDASDSWFETSGNGLTQYWDCEGNLLWSWKSGGFRTVLDLLMKKIPDKKKELPVLNKILYNKEVFKITWDIKDGDEKGQVVVKCSDNTTYSADHVICTVSVGVLKEQAATMFSPSLPENKMTSIKGLHIGTVNKMFLKFPYKWWPSDVQGFNFLWTVEDKQKFIAKYKMASRDRSWLLGVFGFYALDNQPLVLYAWGVGQSGRQMEGFSDAEVIEDLMELLHNFVGDQYEIPPVDGFRRSTWYSNRHFRGSYSCRTMETDKLGASASILAQPVQNSMGKEVLLFAGEATHEHYYSTVHGAIETGWREADRIIRLNRQHILYKAVIIGAGIAGLAAAKTLVEQGMKDIIIVEAQGNPGGRILSVPLENGWVEAGAQWIHGQNNEVWKLANEYNLISDVVSAEGEGRYLREDGLEIDPSIIHEVLNIVNEILEECEKFVNNDSDETPPSIGDILEQKFNLYLQSCGDSDDIKEIKYELYDWHKRFQMIDNSCRRLEDLSAKSWGKYAFCGGLDYVNFREGYSSLINCIIDSLPDNILYLRCPVKTIIWKKILNFSKKNGVNFEACVSDLMQNCSLERVVDLADSSKCMQEFCKELNCNISGNKGDEESPVRIECQDGTFIRAEHVVVTCSLGYLKENYKTMFIPQLPLKICKTIEDMGFAVINKIFLLFEEPWWGNIKGFQLLWMKNNIRTASSSQLDSWTRDLTGFDVLPNHEAVLLGWVGGKGAELVENLSEEEIGEHCTSLLKQFTRRLEIPKPLKVIRSKWNGNPYIRGGYSYTSTRCDRSKVGPSTLAEPVYSEVFNLSNQCLSKCPVLLFAGEAVNETHFSTTHGAYESGQKQAGVIIESNSSIKASSKRNVTSI